MESFGRYAGGFYAYKILVESFDGAEVRPRAYISWQPDPLRTEYTERVHRESTPRTEYTERVHRGRVHREYTDTVAERIDGRVRFISSSDTESLRIGW